MFCNQCGQANSNDAKFCSGCGNRLEIKNIQAVHTPPQLEKNESPQPRKKQVELWNPNAAANWSLLFSPVFGAYIHTKNWEALGDSKKAKQSKIWFYASFLSLIYPLGFFVLITWYFSIGKKQATYINEKFGENYSRKSWGTPLLIGFSIFIVCVFLIMVIPENKNNQTQQNQPQATISPQHTGQIDDLISGKTKFNIPENQAQKQDKPMGQIDRFLADYDQKQAAEQEHFNAIFSAHPDAKSIVQSQEFNNWVNNQSVEWKNYYNEVMDKGTSNQVIEMLNNYKERINH